MRKNKIQSLTVALLLTLVVTVGCVNAYYEDVSTTEVDVNQTATESNNKRDKPKAFILSNNKQLSFDQVVQNLILGVYGQGLEAEQFVKEQGYNYKTVKLAVDKKIEEMKAKPKVEIKPVEEPVAKAPVVKVDKKTKPTEVKKEKPAPKSAPKPAPVVEVTPTPEVDPAPAPVALEVAPAPVTPEVAPAPTPVAPKLSNAEVAKEVLSGMWGGGAERKSKLEAAGYNYKEVQAEVNKIAAANKPAPTPSKPGSSSSSSSYKSSRIYMNGKAMPYITSSYKNIQKDIDRVWNSWASVGTNPSFNPNDNRGTYFAAHNNQGGDIIMKLSHGYKVIVTDSNGTPYTYIVDKIYSYNQEEYWTEELKGNLDKEYIIFQTCEYGSKGGNRHVFATRAN